MSAAGKNGTPPAGEEIHMPGSSAQPLLLAVGITIFLLGLTKSVFLWGAGLLLVIVVIARWIADARRELAELPLHHDGH